MDMVLWCGRLLALVVMAFTVWMLLAGAVAARSPNWDLAMYAAAQRNLAERGLLNRKLSLEERSFKVEVSGAKPEPMDSASNKRLLAALAALTHAPDADFSQLHQLRRATLKSAVERQHRAVARISSPWVFVRVWQACKLYSWLIMAKVGLTWFIPRFIKRALRVGERHLSTATLIGVWVGLLYLGLTQFSGYDSGGKWLSVVGIAVTLVSSLGLMLALIKQLGSVAVIWWGPPRNWPIKGWLTGLGASAIYFVIMMLIWTDQLPLLLNEFASWALRQLDSRGLGETAGSVLLLVALLYQLHGTVILIRARDLYTKDRLLMATRAVFLLALCTCALSWTLATPHEWKVATLWVFAASLVIGLLVFAVFGTVEWIHSYRFVRKAGIRVPRRGYRRWAVLTWISSSLVASVGAALFSHAPHWMPAAATQALLLLLVVLEVILGLSFWPLVVVCVLYVRRISRYATTAQSQ